MASWLLNLGFAGSIGTDTAVPTTPGAEYRLAVNRPHYALAANLAHHALAVNRPHFLIPEDDVG